MHVPHGHIFNDGRLHAIRYSKTQSHDYRNIADTIVELDTKPIGITRKHTDRHAQTSYRSPQWLTRTYAERTHDSFSQCSRLAASLDSSETASGRETGCI